jgi:uncharacterized protein (DUF433 family)
MNFPSIDIQGSILSNDLLPKIRTEQATFQQGKDFNPELTTAKLKDEISLAWQDVKGQWAIFKSKRSRLKEGDSGTTETRNFWVSPLLTNLSYNLVFNRTAEELNGKSFAIGYRDSTLDNFPVYVGGYNESLDKRPENKQLRISPHALLQEYLNYSEHLYGIVTNGRQLRLLRDASRITRLSYVEFNLEKMMEEDLYSDFVILYRLLHASRMPRSINAGAESIIEKYHQEGLEAGSTIRNKLGEAVKEAIKNLANGFINHPNNATLRSAIQQGKVDANEYYHHQLRIIYRLLFLFVIEERNLVYSDSKTPQTKRFNQIYFNYYSLLRLRKSAKKIAPPEAERHFDLWQSLLSTFSLFEKKEIGEKLGIMSLQGDLFSYTAISNNQYDLHQCHLSNAVLLNIVKSLGYFENENHVMIAVNYGGLDVEEFGSVYEGLLELKLVIKPVEGTENYSCSFDSSNERGKSGSHYTPEELVQPLIKHSLEYLIEDRVRPWQQKKTTKETTIQALLTLKICDVACGSGHILLSAARRVALEVARVQTEEEQPNPLAIRRAMKDVVRNCIYGVDKNPLAVELCKIALWLEAYNPGEPLNFLDHHIKCGDAIVGLAHRDELENGIADEAFKTLPGDDKDIAKSYRDKNIKERKDRASKDTQLKAEFGKTTANSVQEAIVEYKTFNRMPETTPEEIERKARAYDKFVASKGFTFLKAMADTQVAQFFISKIDANKDGLMTDGDFRLILSGYKGWQDRKVAKATAISTEQRFFHWFIEFPEVFNDGGFDCILGNPPFLGGLRISSNYGDNYLNYLKINYIPAGGTCDLVAYFFRRNFNIINQLGVQALISTNTISQGDTREGALDVILNEGGVINFSIKSIKWPGQANLEVSLIAINKGHIQQRFCNGKEVESINTFLSEESDIGNPWPLKENMNNCYTGTTVLGKGFILENEEAKKIIQLDSRYKEVIIPYLIGDDLNSSPTQFPSRSVINFFDWDEKKAQTYPLAYEILNEKVKPIRLEDKRKAYRDRWWRFAERRVELYERLPLSFAVLGVCRVTKYLSFSYVPKEYVYDVGTNIVLIETKSKFTLLHSNIHDVWARKYGSSLETRLRYTNEDCFENYPFPPYLAIQSEIQLNSVGETYFEYRRQLMLGVSLGLTKIYNLFHCNSISVQSIPDKDKQTLALQKHLERTPNTITFEEATKRIVKLRDLHEQMDNAVLDAYGWNDIVLSHDFYEIDYLPENDRIRYTIHPDARKEVLKRLLELNHEIHAEETAIAEVKLAALKKVSKASKLKNINTQILFPMRPETAYGAIYSVQDVVRITKLSTTTIKRWLEMLYTQGYEGISIDNSVKEQPLLVNFYGIHELIVIYDLRVVNKIPLQEILDARKWLIQKFGSGSNFYPFTSEKVLDTISKAGKQIIFKEESTGDFITLGKGNSQLNLDFIKEILKRIVFDKEMVSRLYLSDSKLIAIDPNLAGGRPCTVDNGILIDSIKSVFLESKDISYIANVYEISENAVKDALEFDRASVLN